MKCDMIWVWATEEMEVLFVNGVTVGAAVVIKVIVMVYFVVSR